MADMKLCMPSFSGERKCEEPRWGAENPYNNRVLQHNWFEERRQFHQYCPRCTGNSITKTDYLPHAAEDYIKMKCIPPQEYEQKRKSEGEGFLSNRDCEYLRNYTTTNDLMYNWEVRRAGCKEKPNRFWKLRGNAVWQPQPDNALPYGNLTQYGYRQAPQLPLVPNDWKTYDMDTIYKVDYAPKKYPDAYTLTRYAAPKCIRREIDDMTLARKPGLCECCRYWQMKHPNDNDSHVFPDHCHQFVPNVPRVHPTLVPGHTIISKQPFQSVFANSKPVNEHLKHPVHPDPIPGQPILQSLETGPCDTKDLCDAVMCKTFATN